MAGLLDVALRNARVLGLMFTKIGYSKYKFIRPTRAERGGEVRDLIRPGHHSPGDPVVSGWVLKPLVELETVTSF